MEHANAGFDPSVSAKDQDAGPLHASPSSSVLDLPQLYNKPSAQPLLYAMALLAVAPSSWALEDRKAKPGPISEEGVPSYLTRIISSPLAWIPSDIAKEEIWEAASKRLAERSGRTAMPSVSRTFKIPIDGHDCSNTIDIKLHEPSLTGDNLGHKTWVASYLLAKRLPTLLPRLFPSITPSSTNHNPTQSSPNTPQSHHPPTPSHPHILELGAGTGLVGLAASALFQTTTHLTDLPSILPNLTHNIAQNAPLTATSTVTAGPLDWSDPPSYLPPTTTNTNHPESNSKSKSKYNLILAADSLYAPEHPSCIVDVMKALLFKDEQRSARVLVELPFRSAGEPEPAHEELRKRMREAGFVLLLEGEEVGFDDWEEMRGEGGQLEVRCWWGVWGRG